MERTIDFKERRYIEELRILTKATAIDCLIDDRFERIIYVIKPGDMGLAIGKNGDNIKKMSRVLGKRIEMVEFSEDRGQFIANMFKPAKVTDVLFGEPGEPVTILVLERGDFGLAIGKGGLTIGKARLLVRRFFGKDIGDIAIPGEGDE
ncbi:MAG: NusA-like transcription termination signal-binding factor [Methanocalculaceae archaeon]|nr:NusA-like transcription termination signal-binding factor [Methanocalculaceae archaeon]